MLDVGGYKFTTARATLTMGRAAGSLLAEIVSGPCEQDGVYFLDRDGSQFHLILNYLRHGSELFVAPESASAHKTLCAEAKMLRLHEFVELLENNKPDSGRQNQGVYTSADAYFGAPIPQNEVERLQKLASLEVLDTQNTDTEFDNITRCVAAILQVPICLVSLVAEDKQWFKSKCGLAADETSRASSFCAYTLLPEGIEDATVLVVTDARHDVRFMKNPLVLGEPYIQFYAGCPLVTSEGLRMGSLCAIDRIPRDIRPGEVGLLINCAQLVVQALEEQHLSQLWEEMQGEDQQELQEKDVHWLGGYLRTQAMLDAGQSAVVLVWARPDSMDWPLFFGNKVFSELTGVQVRAPSKFPGKAEVKAPHRTEQAGESLWDHIRLKSCEFNKVMELWKMVAVAMTGKKQDTRSSSMAAAATIKHPPSGPHHDNGTCKVLLNCRFTPAELPMSETAAAVKNPRLLSTEKWPRPRGWAGDGHWFFVQMIPELIDENGKHSQLSSPMPAVPKQMDEDMPELQMRLPTGRSVSEGGGLDRDQGTSAAALAVPTKTPTPPFRDVRLVRMVGQGSFGSVYFSLWSGAAVAAKIIKTVVPKGKDVTEVAKTSVFEAILSASISHPNLVQTFKHGSRTTALSADNGGKAKELGNVHETWIVQEWCDGGTLRASCTSPRLEDKGLLEALEVFIEISRAGQYLHDIGLIHGDLTGNNVLLKSMPVPKGYVCKVCDFGLARVLEDEAKEIITQTLGTVTHMPPELLNVSEKCSLTQKADVYALGIISYQVLTAQEPFAGLSAPQVVIQVSRGKRPVLPAVVPEQMAQIFQRTLTADPVVRPTFNDLVDDYTRLFQALGGVDDGAEPPSESTYRKAETYPTGSG